MDKAIVVILLAICSTAFTTPDKIIKAILSKGFRQDNFENSLRCVPCEVTISYPDSSQGAWLIRRHSQLDRHKVKAGWTHEELYS